MLMTNTVMNPSQPSFKVREHKMDNRQILFGNLRIAALGDGKVLVPTVFEVVITIPVIGNNQCAWLNRLLNEAAKRLRAPVRRNGEPDTSGVPSAPALDGFCTRLALPHLYCTGDKNLIMDATAFAARASADPGFIGFDVFIWFTSNTVLIRTYHAGAELVEYLENCLIAFQPKLAPKLHGRHAGRLTGH